MIWPELVGAIGFWIALSLLLLQLIRGSREAVIERLSQLTKVVHWFMIEVGQIDMITFHDKTLGGGRVLQTYIHIPLFRVR